MSTTVESATEDELAELRRSIAATRWPRKELVADPFQAVQWTALQGDRESEERG
jgi:hypothetical protein